MDHALAPPPAGVRGWFRPEAGGGILLMLCAAAALLLVNGVPGGAAWYRAVLAAPAGPLDVHHWINDGLMAVFFLIVGIEIKRECIGGSLSDPRARRLPVVAAAAGMAVPAIAYLALTGGSPASMRGWAIPAATDIAFALGVLRLLGDHAPVSLRVLLGAIAIVDDMGAVAIIAVVYTSHLAAGWLFVAAGILAAMCGMNRRGVMHASPYLAAAGLLWAATWMSGVHATVAGVAAALAIPANAGARIEHRLQPWSAFLIVPLFGFANAGVALPADLGRAILAPVPLGIAIGLFVGKQAGILGAMWIAIRTGIADRPAGAGWRRLHGLATLCGIGFTMSLFIGELAFPGHPELIDAARLGILAGSGLSALAGYALLRTVPKRA